MAPRIVTTLLLVLGLAAAAGTATATATADGDVVVVGDEGQRVIMNLEGGELTVTTEDGEHTSVRIVDMEQVGVIVGDVIEGLDDVLAELAGMQVDVHMGQDNRLNVAIDDESFEVDVDEIVAQVSAALREGLAEFDTGDWTAVRVRGDEEAALREELEALKDELRDMRRQLRQLEED